MPLEHRQVFHILSVGGAISLYFKKSLVQLCLASKRACLIWCNRSRCILQYKWEFLGMLLSFHRVMLVSWILIVRRKFLQAYEKLFTSSWTASLLKAARAATSAIGIPLMSTCSSLIYARIHMEQYVLDFFSSNPLKLSRRCSNLFPAL